jgi:hypothetical protein
MDVLRNHACADKCFSPPNKTKPRDQNLQREERKKKERVSSPLEFIIVIHHASIILHRRAQEKRRKQRGKKDKGKKEKERENSCSINHVWEKPPRSSAQTSNAMQSAVWPASFSPLLSSLFVSFVHSGIRVFVLFPIV